MKIKKVVGCVLWFFLICGLVTTSIAKEIDKENESKIKSIYSIIRDENGKIISFEVQHTSLGMQVILILKTDYSFFSCNLEKNQIDSNSILCQEISKKTFMNRISSSFEDTKAILDSPGEPMKDNKNQ